MTRHKYGARRTGGYASKAEADYAAELALLEQVGAVSDVVEQPWVTLVAGIRIRPDFSYRRADGVRTWVDVKGFETPVFRLKCRLWSVFGPGDLVVIKRQGHGFAVDRVILAAGKEPPCDMRRHPTKPIRTRLRATTSSARSVASGRSS